MDVLIQCDNTEVHESHQHEATIRVECSGKAQCGAWGHSAHRFNQPVIATCSGVCDCKFDYGPHGLGFHK